MTFTYEVSVTNIRIIQHQQGPRKQSSHLLHVKSPGLSFIRDVRRGLPKWSGDHAGEAGPGKARCALLQGGGAG